MPEAVVHVAGGWQGVDLCRQVLSMFDVCECGQLVMRSLQLVLRGLAGGCGVVGLVWYAGHCNNTTMTSCSVPAYRCMQDI